MFSWKEHTNEFLHKLLCHEGLADTTCAICHCHPTHPLPVSTDLGADSDSNLLCKPRLICCKDCYGPFLECADCSLKRHANLPLHDLQVCDITEIRDLEIDLQMPNTQEWNGLFWTKTTTAKIGVVIQLGHEGGFCPLPAVPGVDMVVIDSNGIHEVRTHFCNCARALRANKRQQLMRAGWYPATVVDPQTCATFRVLERYHLLNLVGGVNVHDFMGSLERLTNATEPSLTPVSTYSDR